MIRISLTTLLIVYVLFFGGLLCCAWLIHRWRLRLSKKHDLTHRVRCNLCGCEFEDQTATLPVCIRCGAINERLPLERL